MLYFSFEVKLNGEHKKQEFWEISDVEKQVFLRIQSKLGTQSSTAQGFSFSVKTFSFFRKITIIKNFREKLGVKIRDI